MDDQDGVEPSSVLGALHVEPADVLEALAVLCQPKQPTSEEAHEAKEAHQGEHDHFICQLANNLSRLEVYLGETPVVNDLLSQPECTLESCYSQTKGQDTQWDFVVRCLQLLKAYNVVLEDSLKKYTANEQAKFSAMNERQAAKARLDSSAPSMSPDTLNVGQQKTLVSSLQFVVCLGILPALHPGVGVPLRLRSGFSSLLQKPTTQRTVQQDFHLVFCVKQLLELVQQPALGGLILSRHPGDLLAALCQIVFAPRTRELKQLLKEHEESTGVKEVTEKREITNPPSVPKSEPGENPESAIKQECKHDTSEVVARVDRSSEAVGINPPCITTNYIAIFLDDEAYCNHQLVHLMGRLYPPMLVRELVILQGSPSPGVGGQRTGRPTLTPAPAWLRRACGRLLSDIIVKPDGVQSILKGMLQGPEAQSADHKTQQPVAIDWKKCEAVAGIIANCPRSHSVSDYYKLIGPQVLGLLRGAGDAALGRRQAVQVAVSTLGAMLGQHPDEAQRDVLRPLLQPLTDCLSDKEIHRTEKPVILVEEARLSQCIEDIHKVFVAGSQPLSHSLLQGVLQPLLHAIFALFCLARHAVVNLRSACEEVLVALIKNSDHQVAVRLLRLLAFDDVTEDGADGVRRLHPNVMFAPGQSGAAVVITKPNKGEFDVPAVEDWEARCQCVVDLVKAVGQDDITADLFLSLLGSLTKIISVQVESEKSPPHPDSPAGGQDVLLEIERRQVEMERELLQGLVVLHLLALLAEDVGPAFLKSPGHILDFAKITLERGLQVLRATDDEMMGVFESETVTMAMGMLTALMGGAAELSKQEKDDMSVVLPLLAELADHHPDPQVKDMATDLRVAIATRGAVWSDLLRASRDREKRRENREKRRENMKEEQQEGVDISLEVPTTKGGSTKEEVGGDAKPRRPLIEVISSTDTPQVVVPEPEVKSIPEVSRKQEVSVKPELVGEVKAKTSVSDNKMTSEGKSLKGKDHIATRGVNAQGRTPFQQAVEEIVDPLIPVRGHGLISLRRLVERGDAETLEHKTLLLKVFRENLDHADSYLYLAAVGGLAGLADRDPDAVLPTLALEYADRDPAEGGKRKRSPEVRMKLGEVLVKTSRALGPMVPKYREVLVPAMLTGARDPDPLVRASALSNLGDLCQLLRFSLGKIIHEVLGCVSALIKSDADPEVRKAAALFSTLLLQGLGRDATKVLEGSLRDLYRLLKHVLAVEKEEMVRVHVRLALDELDTIMREQLFPKQTLTKRIRVLDPE